MTSEEKSSEDGEEDSSKEGEEELRKEGGSCRTASWKGQSPRALYTRWMLAKSDRREKGEKIGLLERQVKVLGKADE